MTEFDTELVVPDDAPPLWQAVLGLIGMAGAAALGIDLALELGGVDGGWFKDALDFVVGVELTIVMVALVIAVLVAKARNVAGVKPRPAPGRRATIPQDVRVAVAARDRGVCGECGAREQLQFDHLIPWSKGGADTVENLRLLCGSCNRRKGASW